MTDWAARRSTEPAGERPMREFLYFVASLAGAAMLTALGIIYGPNSGIWGRVFYISAGILTLCAVVLLIDLVRRGTWPKKIAGSRSRIALIAILGTAAVLWSQHWYYSNYSTNGGIWHVQLGLPPTAPPPPKVPEPSKPLPPAAPWVTQEDIEQQQKLGRTLIIYSPEELTAMWVGRQNLTIYQYKWIKTDYPMEGVPYPEKIDKKEYYVVKMRTRSPRLIGVAQILAYFDPKKWSDRLLLLRNGDHVKAVCQFVGFQQGEEQSAYGGIRPDNLIAYECELL